MKQKYFYGQPITEEEQKTGYISYRTLAHCGNLVLFNDVIGAIGCESFDIVNGSEYDESTDTYTEIFQYYVIDNQLARILIDETEEIVFYNENVDLYVWGITHFGTSWDYVYTDIEIKEV